MLLNNATWAVVAGLIATQLIPYLAAYVTSKQGWWTTGVTAILSFLDAVVTQISDKGLDNVDWKKVVELSFGYVVFAYGHHFAFIRGTDVHTWLATHGIAGTTTPAQ